MKPHRREKLLRLIEDDDLSRVKAYMKKHRINVNDVLDENNSTSLHTACRLGHDVIADFLLKQKADLLLPDIQGCLPLHLACTYALQCKGTYVYTDLVQPLIQQCPASLDVPDCNGVKPRHMIKHMNVPRASQEEESQSDADASRRWNAKLAEEMRDDYSEMYGSYHDESLYEDQEPDTYDAWADRMSDQYYMKRNGHTSTYQKSRQRYAKRKQPPDQADESKKPKISDKKKEAFQHKLMEEYDQLRQHDAEKKKRGMNKRREIYEDKCAEIFNSDSLDMVTFSDIPWPHDKAFNRESVEEFLFFDKEESMVTFKKYLKEQQVRWHPDRFQQKCGSRIVLKHKDKIDQKVKEISQLLNCMNDNGS